MPVVDFGRIEGDATLADLLDAFAKVQKALDYLMQGGLDSQNIRAKSIVADRMDVQKLSAISADLGKVIAGILIGAYISTSDGTYPRIDFSSVDKLLTAYNTESQYVSITPSSGGTPGMTWHDVAGNVGFLTGEQSIGLVLAALLGQLTFQSPNDVSFNPSGNLKINGTAGYTGPIDYVKDVVSGSPTFGRITVKKGIITNVS
jgi:hypothetical protein